MELELTKPRPVPTPTSRPFWDALKEARIEIQQCRDCGGWVFYPRNRCSHCLSDALEWRPVSGRATLYTFTVTRQPTSPHFADEVPQRLAVVELEEGVRMTSTLVNVTDDHIRVGMALEPVFDAVDENVTLLRFQPA